MGVGRVRLALDVITIDTATQFGARAATRLADESVIWLTTVDPSGVPQPTPVWFYWTGTQALLFSQPRTPKLRNITANGGVALNVNSTATGGDFVVLTGRALIDPAGPADEEQAAYDAKYAEDLKGLGMTAEEFHASYSVLVRVRPERIRGF
jgi:PPOX class probable F420-dependent enzyme